ncbi:Pre-mRNA-splicing factor cwf16 [Coemansia sp. Benny D160-2]|nr:Pre-mRNA-splicing factor cwf16 [Coemansia sp. Benny D160-2]
MAERKVLNKYIPPDFDPEKIPRLRLGKNRQIKVRLMAPFSMRCETCGQWIGKGTKFNARKEAVEGAKFHSMQEFRFYIRCQRCAAEITYRTDYENLNYEVEKGAQRNFEPWREEKAINEELRRTKEEEEENNPIKALENRTEQSRREMEDLDALDELQMLNARAERVLAGDVLDAIAAGKRTEEAKEREAREAEDQEDDRIARMAFSRVNGRRVKRAREEDADEREREIKQAATAVSAAGSRRPISGVSSNSNGSTSALSRALGGIKSTKPKRNDQDLRREPPSLEQPPSNSEAPPPSPPPPATLAGMLGAYASDNDSD